MEHSEKLPPIQIIDIGNGKDQCRIAERYFYDLLNSETQDRVLDDIKNHVVNYDRYVERFTRFLQFMLDMFAQEHVSYVKQMTIQLYRHFL